VKRVLKVFLLKTNYLLDDSSVSNNPSKFCEYQINGFLEIRRIS